ncbi:MAG: PEP-CTERM sorting domain-containing protein [Pirellulales bacterium]|nr:PEP-CTERM sorting domain-containing protein [Pirellulales bacterium]
MTRHGYACKTVIRAVGFLFLLGFVLGQGLSARADFLYSNFSSVSGLALNGDAVQMEDKLRVARGIERVEQEGSAWHAEKQAVALGFETTFTFNMNDPRLYLDPDWTFARPADGFAFVLQDADSATSALGIYEHEGKHEGSGLGYTNIPRSVAVEFDVYHHLPEEALTPHVSVQTAGAAPNSFEPEYALSPGPVFPVFFDDEEDHTARIVYVPGTMQVYIDDLATPLLTVSLDLTDVGGDNILDGDGKAWVGFTAATGSYCQNHDLLDWQLHCIPEPSTLLLMLSGLGLLGVVRGRK